MAHPFAPFDLVVRTGRVELRLPTDDELVALFDAAAEHGVHDPAEMPFMSPWTDQPADALRLGGLQWHWRCRAELSPEAWNLAFGVFVDGVPVGGQDLGAKDFRTLREVTTGSWLLRSHQGQGIGLQMRTSVLNLAFAGLGADWARTEAFIENAASLGVTRRLGYEPDGISLAAPRGVVKLSRRFRMARAAWEEAHADDDVRVEGLERCLPLLGAERAAG